MKYITISLEDIYTNGLPVIPDGYTGEFKLVEPGENFISTGKYPITVNEATGTEAGKPRMVITRKPNRVVKFTYFKTDLPKKGDWLRSEDGSMYYQTQHSNHTNKFDIYAMTETYE